MVVSPLFDFRILDDFSIFGCGRGCVVVFREARKFAAVRVLTSTFDPTLWGFVGKF
mgnify:CR=1 FL=1